MIADFSGLIVVVVGLMALTVLGVTALVVAPDDDMNTIAAAAFAVIGSVVGAYFGVHAGARERRRADEAHQQVTDRLTSVMMEQANAVMEQAKAMSTPATGQSEPTLSGTDT